MRKRYLPLRAPGWAVVRLPPFTPTAGKVGEAPDEIESRIRCERLWMFGVVLQKRQLSAEKCCGGSGGLPHRGPQGSWTAPWTLAGFLIVSDYDLVVLIIPDNPTRAAGDEYAREREERTNISCHLQIRLRPVCCPYLPGLCESC